MDTDRKNKYEEKREEITGKRAKRGSYEKAILEVIGEKGPMTAYGIAKEILKDPKLRNVIRRVKYTMFELYRTHSIVFQRLQTLHKRQFVTVIEEESRGRKVKKYGLTFKGLIRLAPEPNEIREVVEKNLQTLFDRKTLKWWFKIVSSEGVENIYVDQALHLLLQCILSAEKKEYKKMIKILKTKTDWKRGNADFVISCLYCLYENLPEFGEVLSKVVEKMDEKTVAELLKELIRSLEFDLWYHLDKLQMFKIPFIEKIIEKSNLKDKEMWYELLEFIRDIKISTYYFVSEKYGDIGKPILIFYSRKDRKLYSFYSIKEIVKEVRKDQ